MLQQNTVLSTGKMPDIFDTAVSMFIELGAYENLWKNKSASFKKIADLFREHPDTLPSDHVSEKDAIETAKEAINILEKSGIRKFGVRLNRVGEYPEKLRDSKNPVELLYFQGWWNLIESPCVAVVGTRNPSADGITRTQKLVKKLLEDGFTIVSGLAKGIDTAAHTTAIENGGNTIAVIGTPLSNFYPPENRQLQIKIAEQFLLISQVPIIQYSLQNFLINKSFFPERNITMSALTLATIIVEAGETSGTLKQADAAFHQGRKLFILDNCFLNHDLTWPEKFMKRGAIRVKEYDDIKKELNGAIHSN